MSHSLYNPFPLLLPSVLLRQLSEAKGKRFFVRQSFPRGLQDGLRAAFLLRAYAEDEQTLAEEHFSSLDRDPNAFLYDSTRQEHLEKLQLAATQPAGFKVYYVGRTKLEWRPPQFLDNKLKQYIRTRHPGWRTKKGGDKIEAGLHELFGKIYLTLSFQDQEDKIFLEQLETFDHVS